MTHTFFGRILEESVRVGVIKDKMCIFKQKNCSFMKYMQKISGLREVDNYHKNAWNRVKMKVFAYGVNSNNSCISRTHIYLL